jgi:hypothetical protein
MNDAVHRTPRLGPANASDSPKLMIQRRYARACVAQITLASAALLILAATQAPCPAWAQDTPEPAPQGDAAVTQGIPATAPGAIVRTPEDIQKDRDIVPQSEAPREVPNPPTIPSDQYWKLKQRSGESTPGNEQDSPARK